MIGVVYYLMPLGGQGQWMEVEDGTTLAEIVARAYRSSLYSTLRVGLTRDGTMWEVDERLWSRTRPKAGTVVRITPVASGPAIAPLISLAASAGGQWLGASVLGLSGVGLNLFVAGASIVGSLLASALVPPPEPPKKERERYILGGSSNALAQHSPVPRVFGRHLMYPPLSATGFTDVRGRNSFWTGRFCFGYGPVAVEALRIGTTRIHEFDDVRIEFLNVDQAETVALHPELAGMDVTWRTGTERMTLYSRNIAEDGYSALIDHGATVARETRSQTEEIVVTITFNGLFWADDQGRMSEDKARFDYRWKPVGAADWEGEASEQYSARTRTRIQFEKSIRTAGPGLYVVEVQRTDGPRDGATDAAYLTSIKSVRSSDLPSHAGISEMAVHIRANEQLNGRLDQVNAIVHAMLPVRENDGWTEPRRTRHPAAAWAACLRGAAGGRVLPDAALDIGEVEGWFAEDWTYDAVLTDGTTSDWLREICAAGRRRPMVASWQHQPLPDRAQDHVRGYYTPHNTRGFKMEGIRQRDIHAFRVPVVVEDRDWQTDDIYVYADGYDAATATEIETLELPGVVLPAGSDREGSVYRLARYHLKQALLRRRRFTFETGIDHMAHAVGDKIRVVHDLPQFGVGSGWIGRVEIVGGSLTRVWLDEPFEAAEAGDRIERIEIAEGSQPLGAFDPLGEDVVVMAALPGYKLRMRVRKPDGDITFTVARTEGLGRVWTVLDPDVSGVSAGDLAQIEALSEEPVDLIVLHKTALEDNGAVMTCVEAAPAVLDESEETPAYDPMITPLRTVRREPLPPVITEIASDEATMLRERDKSVRARIAATVKTTDGTGPVPAFKALRWRTGGGPWSAGALHPIDAGTLLTEPLEEGREYEVYAITQTPEGVSSPASEIRAITAQALTAPPPDVTDLALSILGDTGGLSWKAQANALDVTAYDVRHSPNPLAEWASAQPVASVAWPANRLPVVPRSGVYLVRGRDHGGRLSVATARAVAASEAIAGTNVVVTEDLSAFVGTLTDTVIDDGKLVLTETAGIYAAEGIFEAAVEIDLGADYPSAVSASLSVVGRTAQPSAIQDWGPLESLVSLTGADPDGWEAEAQVNVERGGVWSGWQTITGGILIGRRYRFRAVLRSIATGEAGMIASPEMSAFLVTVDMPDRVMTGTASVPATGLTVAFDPPFMGGNGAGNTPVVNATGRNAAAGSTPELTATNTDSFTLFWRLSDGTAVAQDVDWHAKGYGRRVA